MSIADTPDGLPMGYCEDYPDPLSFVVCGDGSSLCEIVLQCLPHIAGESGVISSVDLVSTHRGHDELDTWVTENFDICAALSFEMSTDEDADPLEILAIGELGSQAATAAAKADNNLKKWVRTFCCDEIDVTVLTNILRSHSRTLCDDYHSAWFFHGNGYLAIDRNKMIDVEEGSGTGAHVRYEQIFERAGLRRFTNTLVAGVPPQYKAWRYRNLFLGSPSLFDSEFESLISDLGAKETTDAPGAHVFSFTTEDLDLQDGM